MNYFIIALFIVSPVLSFAAGDEDKTGIKPAKSFLLGQSRLDSGAVLGGVGPDSDLVQRAEGGNVESMVRLYTFYQKEGDIEKANDFLRRAAEKGDIPSLKLVYQQTGEVLSTGVMVVVDSRLFAPIKASLGNRGLWYSTRPMEDLSFRVGREGSDFNDIDSSSWREGLERDKEEIKKTVIYEITDGERNTLETTSLRCRFAF